MKKISYIIAAYNIEDYIERCLLSVLDNEEREIEVVVVNDGSTDDTLNKLNKIASRDNRVKIINQENKGLLEARKTGLRNATAEYVLFMDGDDWIKSELTYKCYDYAKSNDLDILLFNAYYAYENGELKKYEADFNEGKDDYKLIDLILEDKSKHNVWNKLIKRDFIPYEKFMELPKITMGEDYAIIGLLSTYNPKIKILNEPYYYYYMRTNSVTKKSSEKHLEVIKMLNYLDEIVVPKKSDSKEISEFLWFQYCYYQRIIAPRYKRTEVEKQLYYKWKQKNIKFKENDYCKELIAKKSMSNKILVQAFNLNYSIGNMMINFIIATKALLRRKNG